MKNFKRLFAAAAAVVMTLSFAGCHKKNETAISVGDLEFTSAYYMCAFLEADSEANAKVYETLTDEEKQNSDLDLRTKKIDGKSYNEWVKETANEKIKTVAAYKILCEENKVELKKEMADNMNSYASYYYSYGYTPSGRTVNFADNGVSQDTYTKYLTDTSYNSLYFDHLYAKDGEKEIAAKDVKSKIYGNFVIANVLNAKFEDNATDDQKEALEKKLKAYVKDLEGGKKTFEEVYNEYNGVKEDEHDHEQEDKDEETSAPKDKLATVIGSEDTSYSAEYYDTVKKMKKDAVKLIELEDGTGYPLVVKQDIKADGYYLESLDSEARHMIADEEYEKLIKDYVKTLKADVSKYAIGQFKVKNIVPVSNQQ